MADTKFTPGPWVWQNEEECLVGPKQIVMRQDEEGRKVFAWYHDGMTQANAHLIAAAPELYEALYRLVTDCEIAGLQEQAGFDCWISMANAALAKARGEVT